MSSNSYEANMIATIIKSALLGLILGAAIAYVTEADSRYGPRDYRGDFGRPDANTVTRTLAGTLSGKVTR